MHFKDREEAGTILAKKLDKYRQSKCVVYALPRGGVPLGAKIARHLNAPLDLIITRKIGHPNWSEYAICAVSENGAIICNNQEIESVNQNWLDAEIEKQRQEAKRRRLKYLAGRDQIEVANKIAIITDDGVATGLTMIAAIEELKSRNPAKVVVAVPVIPKAIANELRKYADEIISFTIDENFLGSVSAYYDKFEQTTDKEVIGLLDSVNQTNH